MGEPAFVGVFNDWRAGDAEEATWQSGNDEAVVGVAAGMDNAVAAQGFAASVLWHLHRFPNRFAVVDGVARIPVPAVGPRVLIEMLDYSGH